jgi:hypothetical protein
MSDVENIFEESNRYLENGKVEKVFEYLNVRGG